MQDGFLKVAAATPALRVADCAYNAQQIATLAQQAAQEGARVIVFPELCVTAYTCGDLFLSQTLLGAAEQALSQIASQTGSLDAFLVVGLPLRHRGKLYNVAACLHGGDVLGFVPKQHIPNYSEFYELRHFTPAVAADADTHAFAGHDVPFGTDLLFACTSMPELVIGAEICEDVWVPDPPSGALCRAGATVIVNPSASDETIGKAAYRRQLIAQQSARCVCAYLYADAGQGESSTDLVFAAHNLIAENGTLLAEAKRFDIGLTMTELDIDRIAYDRRRMNTFCREEKPMRVVRFSLMSSEMRLTRSFAKTPFVPQDPRDLEARCEEILSLQSAGLTTRLRHTHCERAVVGLSGGLDSTLALIVAVHAFEALALDRRGILAVTMPCFGTTGRTKSNAVKLAEAYGVTLKTVDIQAAVRQHFSDIGHDVETLDVTFENAQARMRTLVLMDLANQTGGLVIGTGDLSELALGWATYNGDHMSMYGVNGGVPKTLVRYLTAYEAAHTTSETLKTVLLDVLGTPVSPELLPPSDGEISQKTEELVGPYELHDFFLYYMLRFGFSPRKIFRLANQAFAGDYSPQVIRKWLTTFVRRFFAQQFKRSCLPDGPKVGSVTLSPRGDWRMPSDACATAWMDELERL